MNKKLPVIILLLTVSALIAFTFAACIPKGSIIILEDRDGKGVLAELKEYDKVDKWELPLSKGDEVRVEVERVEGIIGLTVSGKKAASRTTAASWNRAPSPSPSKNPTPMCSY